MAFHYLFRLKIVFSILQYCLEFFEYPASSQNVGFHMSPKVHGNHLLSHVGKYYA